MTRPSLTDLQRMDQDIRAWAYLPTQEVAAGPGLGPLSGMRFGVKDVMDVRGMPTRYGANLQNVPPARFDAACVTMLRAAGAEPIGKTVTAEFAYAAPGPTRNPVNLAHTPGGSSSGSAAAVAAGMVDFALGTQTGGSMIRPAAYNGVIGFKPSFGRVPRAGMQVLCDTLDTIGWFTRDIHLSRKIAGIFMPPAPLEPARHDLSIVVLPCTQLGELSESAANCLRRAADTLRDRGFSVSWQDFTDLETESLSVHSRIMSYELSRSLLPVLQAEPDVPRAQTLRVIEEGLEVSTDEYDGLIQRRRTLASIWLDKIGTHDLILAPSAPGVAPLGHASTGTSIFNRIWSLLGWPAIHLPTSFDAAGMPLGVQCIGLPGTDMRLLSQAETLHRIIDQRQ